MPWKAASEAEITKLLGPPTDRRAAFADEDELTVADWAWPLDTAGHVETRAVKGSEFVKQALPRGLWDDHLRDVPGLREVAWRWFHNMNGLWITADLKKTFGKRVGPFGHDQPKLDDDTWDAVDKAAPLLDERFAAWIAK